MRPSKIKGNEVHNTTLEKRKGKKKREREKRKKKKKKRVFGRNKKKTGRKG